MNGGSVCSLVSEALDGGLDAPLHTLFQASSSWFLTEGVHAQAVTCAKLLEHGDSGLGTFTGLDGEMVMLDGAICRVQGNGTVSDEVARYGSRTDHVTHEAICAALQTLPRAELRREPIACLRQAKPQRGRTPSFSNQGAAGGAASCAT